MVNAMRVVSVAMLTRCARSVSAGLPSIAMQRTAMDNSGGKHAPGSQQNIRHGRYGAAASSPVQARPARARAAVAPSAAHFFRFPLSASVLPASPLTMPELRHSQTELPGRRALRHRRQAQARQPNVPTGPVSVQADAMLPLGFTGSMPLAWSGAWSAEHRDASPAARLSATAKHAAGESWTVDALDRRLRQLQWERFVSREGEKRGQPGGAARAGPTSHRASTLERCHGEKGFGRRLAASAAALLSPDGGGKRQSKGVRCDVARCRAVRRGRCASWPSSCACPTLVAVHSNAPIRQNCPAKCRWSVRAGNKQQRASSRWRVGS